MNVGQFLIQMDIWKESLKDIPHDRIVSVDQPKDKFTAFIVVPGGAALAMDFDNYNEILVRRGLEPIDAENISTKN